MLAIPVVCLGLNEWDWSMKEQYSVKSFGVLQTASLHINMKNCKKIAYTDFVKVDIALNLHSYENCKNMAYTDLVKVDIALNLHSYEEN